MRRGSLFSHWSTIGDRSSIDGGSGESVTSTGRLRNSRAARDAFHVHREMVTSLFLATFFLVAVSLLLFLVRKGPNATAFTGVLLIGALCGFVSALGCLYSFERVFPTGALTTWLNKAGLYVAIYSTTPSLVGAIFAGVLYILSARDPRRPCSQGRLIY